MKPGEWFLLFAVLVLFPFMLVACVLGSMGIYILPQVTFGCVLV